jgi:DNA polymerase-3 subunit epsilon
VLVCNTDGRILLYNQQARSLLEGPVWRSSTQWIGLGRSIYRFLDKDAVEHALISIEYRLSQGETGLMVPFGITRPNGQLLSVHLVPVLDTDNKARGYVFTLEDITRRIGSENRQKTLLTTLTGEHRSTLTGIRAAIETVIEFPDMDEAGRNQFLQSIRDDAVRMSEQLNVLAKEQPQDFAGQWAFQDMLGGDLLAIIEMELVKATGMSIKTSAPVEPVWLRVDSYALGRCILFLLDRLVHACRAEEVRLALERDQQLAAMTLRWSGAPLHTEALKSWGMLTVPMGEQEASGSLFEIIERHGGAIWAHPASPTARSSLRLVLPVLEDQKRAGEAEADAEGAPRHEFDFTLFQATDKLGDRDTTPLEKLTYTVLDTEATGLRPSDGDELIAIGAVRIVNGRVLRREVFDCLIDPRRTISEEAQAVHGISASMLRGRPTVDEVLPRFRRFVEDTVIVGHNVAFDMRFFELKEEASGIKFDNPVLDTLQLSCIAQPGRESQALDEACERLGIAITGRHTALGDALATAEVFLALIPMLKAEGITTLPQALAACQGTKYAKLKY